MINVIILIYLYCLCGTYTHTFHAPVALILPYWIWLISVVKASFTFSVFTTTCASRIDHFECGYVLFSSVPLKYMHRTFFYALAASYTGIPINCNSCSVYT